VGSQSGITCEVRSRTWLEELHVFGVLAPAPALAGLPLFHRACFVTTPRATKDMRRFSGTSERWQSG
jgi:hypothetical protein